MQNQVDPKLIKNVLILHFTFLYKCGQIPLIYLQDEQYLRRVFHGIQESLTGNNVKLIFNTVFEE
jgi:hypothetical protein